MWVIPVIMALIGTLVTILMVTQVILPAITDKRYFPLLNRETWFRSKDKSFNELDADEQMEVAEENYANALEALKSVQNTAKGDKKEAERNLKDAEKLKKKLK